MAPKHRLYTPEIADDICEKLEEGMGLNTICRAEGMPTEGAVRYWVQTDHDGFAAKYAQARARGYERLADEILEIADDGSNDSYKDGEGNDVINYDHIQRSKLRVDSRKWMLSKVLPKTYGDRLELGGEVGIKNLSSAIEEGRKRARGEPVE